MKRAAGPDFNPFVAIVMVFLPFSGGYFLSYLYRTVNAVIAPDLVATFGLDAASLGLLTAAYFLTFAAFQIPLGLLLDRFGPRRVQACLLLVAATGALLFAMAGSFTAMITARAMIGLGVAGGLMASFKAIVLWFPKERWPLVNFCFLSIGGLGALSATAPVEWALGITDWRGVFMVLATANYCVAALIFMIVPERATGAETTTIRQALQSLGMIYRDPLVWRLAPACVIGMGFGMAFQGLWAGPWLRDIVGMSRAEAANALFMLAVFMVIGFLANGIITDFLCRRGMAPLTIMRATIAAYVASQVVLVIGWHEAWIILLLGVGLLSNASALSFSVLSGYFGEALSGRSNTAVNLLIFASAFASQYLVGAIVDLWPTQSDGRYQAIAFQYAFGVIWLAQLVAWIWFVVSFGRSQLALDRAKIP